MLCVLIRIASPSNEYPQHMGRVKRIWYLWPMRVAKVQASLSIHAVLLEPPLLAHTSSESRGTFRQKARSLAPLNDRACTVKICHDGMLEDTNSLDAPHMCYREIWKSLCTHKNSKIILESHFTLQKTIVLLHKQEKLSHIIRKPVYALCKQRRCRSAWQSCSLISTFVVHCLDGIAPKHSYYIWNTKAS